MEGNLTAKQPQRVSHRNGGIRLSENNSPFRKYNLLPDPADVRDFLYTAVAAKKKLPAAVDLRPSCPPVYDQGGQGSCASHAGCACRTMLAHDANLDLSRAFLYYEARALSDATQSDAGATMRDTCRTVRNFGVCLSQLMPYRDDDYRTPPSAAALADARSYRISAYRRLIGIDQVRDAIAVRGQPVLTGIPVFASMESEEVARTGTLPMPGLLDKKRGNHAVLLVGYCDGSGKGGLLGELMNVLGCGGEEDGYFIARNSWGEGWGDKGCFRMPYAYFLRYALDNWIMEA